MLQFHVDEALCTHCGLCAADCPAKIIDLENGIPAIPARKERACFRCQHCLAICPCAAISILGKRPADSQSLADEPTDPGRLSRLIRGRRSVRSYRDENLDPTLIRELLETAWHAPTGHNNRRVRLTVIADRQHLARLRRDVLARVANSAREKTLPEGLEFFAAFPRTWERNGEDVIFRGAPHLLIASAPSHCVVPKQDCLIALATFDLLAQSAGVGTVWNGLATWAFEKIAPDLKVGLNLPEGHQIGYMMSFGPPAVRYARTVQHDPADIVFSGWE